MTDQREIVQAIAEVRKLISERNFSSVQKLIKASIQYEEEDIATARYRAAYTARSMIPGWREIESLFSKI